MKGCLQRYDLWTFPLSLFDHGGFCPRWLTFISEWSWLGADFWRPNIHWCYKIYHQLAQDQRKIGLLSYSISKIFTSYFMSVCKDAEPGFLAYRRITPLWDFGEQGSMLVVAICFAGDTLERLYNSGNNAHDAFSNLHVFFPLNSEFLSQILFYKASSAWLINSSHTCRCKTPVHETLSLQKRTALQGDR